MTLLKVERFATFIDDLSNGCIAAREQLCNELFIFMASFVSNINVIYYERKNRK